MSSALARAEVFRAVLHMGDGALRRARATLASLELVRVTTGVLDQAGILKPANLRTLDAIHLATASLFGDTLDRVITYDDRMTRAAQAMGWRVEAPS